MPPLSLCGTCLPPYRYEQAPRWVASLQGDTELARRQQGGIVPTHRGCRPAETRYRMQTSEYEVEGKLGQAVSRVPVFAPREARGELGRAIRLGLPVPDIFDMSAIKRQVTRENSWLNGLPASYSSLLLYPHRVHRPGIRKP